MLFTEDIFKCQRYEVESKSTGMACQESWSGSTDIRQNRLSHNRKVLEGKKNILT